MLDDKHKRIELFGFIISLGFYDIQNIWVEC